jgi:hypothetical protein
LENKKVEKIVQNVHTAVVLGQIRGAPFKKRRAKQK